MTFDVVLNNTSFCTTYFFHLFICNALIQESRITSLKEQIGGKGSNVGITRTCCRWKRTKNRLRGKKGGEEKQVEYQRAKLEGEREKKAEEKKMTYIDLKVTYSNSANSKIPKY